MSGDDTTVAPGSAPAAVIAMLDGMRAVGVNVDAVCAAAGVSEKGLHEHPHPVQLEELVSLWQHATRQFGRGTLGLHVGSAAPQGALLDYLASFSPTLHAALGQIARYIGLNARNVRWVVGARAPDGLTPFETHLVYGEDAIPPCLREFGVAIVARRLRDWFVQSPREAWFKHAPQGPLEEYQQVLGCPARFERECTALRFDDLALQAPARSHDPQLFRLLESQAERVLAETPAAATFRERVRRAVVERLREGEPAMAAIAESLATSERTLQRKLQAEGVSFRDVVDDARHKLAMMYFGDHSLSLADVAYLLGYSEAAAFTRAFKRWTGQAPSSVRSL